MDNFKWIESVLLLTLEGIIYEIIFKRQITIINYFDELWYCLHLK